MESKRGKTIVGDLTALYGNQVECEIYKQIKGETYIEDGWEELLGTLQAQYSASFYPYVGADSFVSEGNALLLSLFEDYCRGNVYIL